MAQREAVQSLIEMGFSQYEAQAYVGLLGAEPMTGYGLSNVTGIPQPKVYETLRRLASKGMVAAVGGEPAKFVAVPVGRMLSDLEDSFRARLSTAEKELARVGAAGADDGYRVLRSLGSWAAIEKRAAQIVNGATRHVYVSINCEDSAEISGALADADSRGVICDVLYFGKPIVELGRGRTVGHDSTQGVVYRRHQARHLAVVGDSSEVLWAVADDGRTWQSMTGDDHLLAALAKGYIRHDLYVQQIWNEFHDSLQERFGPGMQQLVSEANPAAPASSAQGRRRRGRSA